MKAARGNLVIGLPFVALTALLLILGLPRAWLYPYVSQTIYSHKIDDSNTIRIFSKYYSMSGVAVYCELLHDAHPACGPKDLFLCNLPLKELTFETIETPDSLVAVVRPAEPFTVLYLIDLQTMEANRQGNSEFFDHYLKRKPLLLDKFRHSTGEPRYDYHVERIGSP